MLRLSLFSFVVFVSQSLAAPAPKNEWSKEPSPEVVKAWRDVGAGVGCHTGYRTSYGGEWPETGGMLTFTITAPKKGILPKLPDPDTPFHICFERVDGELGDIFEEIKHFKNLVGLDLSWAKNFKGQDLGKIAQFKQFRFLGLASTECDDETVKRLEKFDNLQDIYLGSTKITDLCAPSLAKLKKLQILQLENTSIGDNVLEVLSKHEGVKSLFLQKSLMTDEGLKSLSQIESLESLELGIERKYDKGVKHLAKLKNLTQFRFRDDSAPNDLLEAISNCTKIQNFGLDVKEQPKGFSNLAKLKALRNFWLQDTPFDADDFKALLGLEKLEQIESRYKGIDDTTIVGVSKIKNLNHLFLHDAKLTRKSIPELLKMKTLYNISFNGSELSEDDVKNLKGSLPKCNVRVRD